MAQEQIRRDYEFYRQLSPEKYPEELKLWFERKTGETLDLEHPKTFNEKVQWLKLYDSTPEKTRLADKYLVRDWVKEKIGEEYLIPLLGVWDSFDEIDFDALPNSFVLKANHGCKWNVIVKEKALLDREAAKYDFDYWLKYNFALQSLELHYGDIRPKIIAEQYMENAGEDLHDYKVFCFNGRAESILYMQDRKTELTQAFFDTQWRKQSFVSHRMPMVEEEVPRPKYLERMISLAETLAAGFALVRVDFYVLNDGSLKFGEMTFTPATGTNEWHPPEQNLIYGEMLTLPEKKYPLPDKSFAQRGVPPLPGGFRKRETDIQRELEQALEEKAGLKEKLQQTFAEKSEINAKLRQTYAEKSELNAKLQQTYAEKSELNAKLQQTYAEKAERGIQIKVLQSERQRQSEEILSLRQQLAEELRRLTKKYEELDGKYRAQCDERQAQGEALRRLTGQYETLRREKAGQDDQVRTLKKQLSAERGKNRKLKRSRSYRIGRAITWPLRKLKAVLKGRK